MPYYNIKLTAPFSHCSEGQALYSEVLDLGGEIEGYTRTLPWVTVKLPHNMIHELLERVPVVEAERDSGCDVCLTKVDPNTSIELLRWPLVAMRAYEAHRITYGAGSRIAVIDSGLGYHPEIESANIVYTESFDSKEGIEDRNGHGTSTLGLLAAQGHKLLGVAPDAELVVLKALNKSGRGRWSWVARALERGVEMRCNVAVMALGASDNSIMLEDTLHYAVENGLIPVAAAGNDGNSHLDYPGSSYWSITAAAIDSQARHPRWSSWSRWPSSPDIAAPGAGIPTISPRDGGSYVIQSGTSLSTALVGGCLALALSRVRASNMRSVRDLLQSSARELKLSRDVVGAGLIDASAMV